MRILVTGSREWVFTREDMSGMVAFDRAISAFLRQHGLWDDEVGMPFGPVTIVHGGLTRGLDFIADEWAIVNWVAVEVYNADWDRYGKGAGPIRNQQMVDSGADVCIAFPLASSRGTWDCVRRATAAGIPVIVYDGKVSPNRP